MNVNFGAIYHVTRPGTSIGEAKPPAKVMNRVGPGKLEFEVVDPGLRKLAQEVLKSLNKQGELVRFSPAVKGYYVFTGKDAEKLSRKLRHDPGMKRLAKSRSPYRKELLAQAKRVKTQGLVRENATSVQNLVVVSPKLHVLA